MPKNTDSTKLITFSKVTKVYGAEQVLALRDVSFSVAAGDFVCIIGPSGCGKSTVLKIIAGLERQSSGEVNKPDSVAMVFQSGALFPWLSVFDNVSLALRSVRHPASEALVRKETLRYLAMMGLQDYVGKYPHELSGGQRQRVGIARALAVDPAVLLMDEPFSALDVGVTEELHRDIVKIWQESKKTIIMVSHSVEEAVTLAARIILMKDYTVAETFPVTLPRPRREQEVGFTREVLKIRKYFFTSAPIPKNGVSSS